MAESVYIAYGRSIACDLDLGEYLLAGDVAVPDIRLEESSSVHREQLTEHFPLFTSHQRNLTLQTDRPLAASQPGQPWCCSVGGVVNFHWQGEQNVIRIERLEHCTDELLAFWLIHIFLPLYLTLNETYEFIHACAVQVGEVTVLFTAPSHGGKSTLTDYFLQQGHALVSDDKVATLVEEGQFIAVPSHPNHRPYRRFEDLGIRVSNFDPRPRPIDAIYALVGVEEEGEVEIEQVTGHRSFAQLAPSYLFRFNFMKEKRLRYLAKMVGSVPLYRLNVPWSLERLGEVHEAICSHRR